LIGSVDWRKPAAELLGTAFLLAAIVGSGIMAERLSAGNVAVALLANALATGGALFALIHTFGPISGAHFNPAVTLVLAFARETPRGHALPYILAQIGGALAGVWAAHLMFDLPVLQASGRMRTGLGQWTGEAVATFGLVAVIMSGRRHFVSALPAVVAAYIVAAYWFTSSTSFANPAVTLARSLTDTFAGIAPVNVVGFVLAQALGATVGLLITQMLELCHSPAASARVQMGSCAKVRQAQQFTKSSDV
jgi:glycerol uptake facilitator-like aquaporin